MKKLFAMAAAAIFSASTLAQVQSDIKSATLIHGDQTTVYYGTQALRSAYEAAAQDGDVIVLSPGKFNGQTIAKSITIYGAGYEYDPVSGAEPTSTSLDIACYRDYDENGNPCLRYPIVHLEGIDLTNRTDYMNLSVINTAGVTIENLVVRKCKLTDLHINAASRNCSVIQCVIMRRICEYSSTGASAYQHTLLNPQNNLNFENCWISEFYGGGIDATIQCNHCIIFYVKGGYAHFTNSIIYGALPNTCTANNCIFTSSTIGTEVTDTNNWTGITADGIWTSGTYTYSADNDYILRFPAKYIGTDGTEVGINGGNAPFNRISPIPRILESNIDLQTTADGKLNVSLKVEAQTK